MNTKMDKKTKIGIAGAFIGLLFTVYATMYNFANLPADNHISVVRTAIEQEYGKDADIRVLKEDTEAERNSGKEVYNITFEKGTEGKLYHITAEVMSGTVAFGEETETIHIGEADSAVLYSTNENSYIDYEFTKEDIEKLNHIIKNGIEVSNEKPHNKGAVPDDAVSAAEPLYGDVTVDYVISAYDKSYDEVLHLNIASDGNIYLNNEAERRAVSPELREFVEKLVKEASPV